MKREIKFRCWCRDGEWEESGEKMKFTMIDADSLCFNLCIPLKDQLTDIEDEQYFMQYTGMKDKNGVEIYEGDIVKAQWWDGYNREDKFTNHEVYFDTEMLEFGLKNLNELFHCQFNHEFEVIGNIYQNPELINEAV